MSNNNPTKSDSKKAVILYSGRVMLISFIGFILSFLFLIWTDEHPVTALRLIATCALFLMLSYVTHKSNVEDE